MAKPGAESFKQLTISVERLPASMAQQAQIENYAAQRAKLLLSCYRTGDANDPDTYVAAVAATLSRFPMEVITEVTHPASGLPTKLKWLPSVQEVYEACMSAWEPIKQRIAREKRIKDQLAARVEQDQSRVNRPSYDELKAKYGENWGIEQPIRKDCKADQKALAAAQERVRREYAAIGKEPPSALALSPTALKAMHAVAAERNRETPADKREDSE